MTLMTKKILIIRKGLPKVPAEWYEVVVGMMMLRTVVCRLDLGSLRKTFTDPIMDSVWPAFQNKIMKRELGAV